jgi:hypothetical protein
MCGLILRWKHYTPPLCKGQPLICWVCAAAPRDRAVVGMSIQVASPALAAEASSGLSHAPASQSLWRRAITRACR